VRCCFDVLTVCRCGSLQLPPGDAERLYRNDNLNLRR